jgi:hypothetical protein
MFKFLKSLFGGDQQTNQEAGVQVEQVPYKVEPPVVEDKVAVANRAPAKCGCGRSSTGLCVGLHKLTEQEWADHDANPNKKLQQARNQKGQFVADDPATPENEAWIGGKSPAQKKPAAIKGTKKPAAKKAAAKKPVAKKTPAKKKPTK